VADALADSMALTAREVAYGFVYGGRDFAAPLPVVEPGCAPLAALEQAMLPALRRSPCVVGFSGGRDSSAVLAVAARVARREGLALPVPVTMRFPGASASGESSWQERVVRHLGLADWERIEPGDLDLVGTTAARCLRTHGLLWPANTHAHMPLLARARGGSLLSGIDGDSLFGGWAFARVGALLSGRASLEPRDVIRLGYAAAPRFVRGWVARRRAKAGPVARWLRPDVRAASANAMTGWTPVRWSGHVAALAGMPRWLAVVCASMQALADDTGTLLVHPFLDQRFLAALRSEGGAWGWGDRSATMAALFGELLPTETVTRATKARFDEVFWGEPSRAFARAWDGSGIDETLVDPEALRSEWLAQAPDFRSATLLQSAWLHAARQATAAALSGRRASGSGAPGGTRSHHHAQRASPSS
jgi:asparagine synthase (glutamine-hydrolysing)